MNHPRRLLFLVPLSLLGAALLMRARLPRPQTEGDKWLWEQAEQAPALTISYQDVEEDHKDNIASGGFNGGTIRILKVSDRQGIRDLLRSLSSTPSFTPFGHRWHGPSDYEMSLGRDHEFWITHQGSRFFLYRKDRRIAPLNQRALTRFRQVFQAALVRAKQRQEGYRSDIAASWTL